PPDLSPSAIGETLREAFTSGTRRERNEARAGLAGVEAAFNAAVEDASAPPRQDARDFRPLDSAAIVGTWRNALAHATFSENGSLTVDIFGRKTTGRWSVDAEGRLSADIMGQRRTTNASIAGDQLTIALGDRPVTLTRSG